MGIGRFAFVRASRAEGDADRQGRNGYKPVWVDLRNPICLDMLESIARDADWITFTEMLPAHDEMFVSRDGYAHASEIMIEMTM